MTPTQHYFSNAVGSVDFVPHEYVYLHWTGAPLSSIEFRALYVHARNLLRRHRLKGILADHHAMPNAPDSDDREWLLNEWLPQTLEETPFTHYAVIPMPDAANRLHTDTVLQDLRQLVTVGVFDNLDQARSWMKTAKAG